MRKNKREKSNGTSGRRSASADASLRAEIERVLKLSVAERMAEALDLGQVMEDYARVLRPRPR